MKQSKARSAEVASERRREVDAMLRRRDLPPRVRERLKMVKAAGLGHDLKTIATWSGRKPRRTVRRWLGLFGEGGVDALADASRALGVLRGRRTRPT